MACPHTRYRKLVDGKGEEGRWRRESIRSARTNAIIKKDCAGALWEQSVSRTITARKLRIARLSDTMCELQRYLPIMSCSGAASMRGQTRNPDCLIIVYSYSVYSTRCMLLYLLCLIGYAYTLAASSSLARRGVTCSAQLPAGLSLIPLAINQVAQLVTQLETSKMLKLRCEGNAERGPASMVVCQLLVDPGMTNPNSKSHSFFQGLANRSLSSST